MRGARAYVAHATVPGSAFREASIIAAALWQICPGLIRPEDSTPQVANKLRSALVNVSG